VLELDIRGQYQIIQIAVPSPDAKQSWMNEFLQIRAELVQSRMQEFRRIWFVFDLIWLVFIIIKTHFHLKRHN